MPALWIAHVEVTDEEKYAEYIKIASEVIPAHGGTFIARGGKVVNFEGIARPRNVVAKFPSVEAAEAAYADPKYQEAVAIAKVSSTREVMVVETTE